MTKKKKKESWKEKRRQAAIKHQKALEAERLKREREPKKRKGWSKGKIFGVAFMFLLIIGIYGAWQYTQSSPSGNSNVNKQKAPLFTLVDIDGNEVKLENLTGKVVILNFFDTQCTYCIPEISELSKIYAQYRSDDVVIISIDVYPPNIDTIEVLHQFRQNHQISWIIAQDTAGVFDAYITGPTKGTPTTVIVDQEGFISPHSPFIGLASSSTFSDEIDSLL
jgi:peroxiredoxin